MSSSKGKIVYHKQEEEILKRWSEISSSYRYLHNASYSAYQSLYTWFSLPVIILSTTAGAIGFATNSFPEAWRSNITLGVGGINMIAGLITTIAQFFDISSNLEGHRAASVEFSKLSRNIAIELSLPIGQRSMSGTEFIKQCRTKLDSLMEKSPDIPYKIVRTFAAQFEGHEFVKPDILEILPVHVYRDHDEEMEKEKKKLDVLRKAAQDEVRLHIETTAEEVARKRHQMKKRRVSATNVADSMSRLISSIESASSSLPTLQNVVVDGDDEEEKKDDSGSEESDLTVCSMDDDDDDANIVREVPSAPQQSPPKMPAAKKKDASKR